MKREEAIYSISIATGELEDIVEHRANAVYEIYSLPIVNIHNYNVLIEKPTLKPYISPYANKEMAEDEREDM